MPKPSPASAKPIARRRCATRRPRDAAACHSRALRLHAPDSLRRRRARRGSRSAWRLLRRHVGRGHPVSAKETSCGVIVTDGQRILLGHATRSPRWDIPKGVAEPGEDFAAAACRELFEETGLSVMAAELKPLGVFPYRSGKDLALFVWPRPEMPDPNSLVCASCFSWKGTEFPEFDRFGLFSVEEAVSRVGKAMAERLGAISIKRPSDASS